MSADATGRTFVIDSYNIHRLVIAGVTVASKFFSDVFYTNSRYAKVGGLPLPELNQLELQFLLLNDFRLVISSEEMQRYAEQLILFSRSSGMMGGAVDGQDHTACSSGANGAGAGIGVGGGATSSACGSNAGASVAAPMSAMGAVDAYGGRMADDTNMRTRKSTSAIPSSSKHHSHSHNHLSHHHHNRTHHHHRHNSTTTQDSDTYDNGDDDDAETEVGTEDGSVGTNTTDDEPTIRANSVATRGRRRESIDEAMGDVPPARPPHSRSVSERDADDALTHTAHDRDLERRPENLRTRSGGEIQRDNHYQ